uniref:Uncharacterized protein n=1 Tax=Anguilla anguilla TaxID=7936 RepID=A0A0E9QQD3_ANGAN
MQSFQRKPICLTLRKQPHFKKARYESVTRNGLFLVLRPLMQCHCIQ